jgi:hypothetical protein
MTKAIVQCGTDCTGEEWRGTDHLVIGQENVYQRPNRKATKLIKIIDAEDNEISGTPADMRQAATAIIAMTGGPDALIKADLHVMKTSAGADYYVRLKQGDRSFTPYMFKERYKAEYHIDLFKWLFGELPEEPDCMKYDEKSHPDTH